MCQGVRPFFDYSVSCTPECGHRLCPRPYITYTKSAQQLSPFSFTNDSISKAKATEKVDLAVALVMALDRALRNEDVSAGSVYEDRGLLFI